MRRSLSCFSTALAFVLLIFAEHMQAQPPKEITNSIGMKRVLIPKSPEADRTHSAESGK
ncbi:MAG: hypothetical protein NTV29_00180 [Planctomycetota bacterium]|nr:hypothetical protein [Planctomycetota bacterium]